MQKISSGRTAGKDKFHGQLTLTAFCTVQAKLCPSSESQQRRKRCGRLPENLPQRRMAMETGTHLPWVSRLLAVLGHDVIV